MAEAEQRIADIESRIAERTRYERHLWVQLNALADRYRTGQAHLQEIEQRIGLHRTAEQLEQQIASLQKQVEGLERATGLYGNAATLQQEIARLETEMNEVVEAHDLQEVGFYQLRYSFIESERYRAELEQVRAKQKAAVKAGQAVICDTAWTVNGSEKEGQKMVKAFLTIVLKAFNGECDACVASVNYRNVTAYEKRISKLYDTLNKLANITHCSIQPAYLELRLAELHLAYEYQLKKRTEQEEQRLMREQMREEEKARREAERAQEEAEREERLYEKLLLKAQAEMATASVEKQALLHERIHELQEQLEEAHRQKERAISQAQLTKAGHVYVISNIGSFGPDVYKIGLTRRLEPEDRVKELGDASVPFPFDIHALIYSTNAPELENLLHKRFAHRRVNMVNERREFFRVTIYEIEQAVRDVALTHPQMNPDFEIAHEAAAEQYAQSLAAALEMERQGRNDRIPTSAVTAVQPSLPQSAVPA